MSYIIVNKTALYKYFPFQGNGLTFTWQLENAKEYNSYEEAQEGCKWLHKYLLTKCILTIVEKEVLLRKDKLKKLNEVG